MDRWRPSKKRKDWSFKVGNCHVSRILTMNRPKNFWHSKSTKAVRFDILPSYFLRERSLMMSELVKTSNLMVDLELLAKRNLNKITATKVNSTASPNLVFLDSEA